MLGKGYKNIFYLFKYSSNQVFNHYYETNPI